MAFPADDLPFSFFLGGGWSRKLKLNITESTVTLPEDIDGIHVCWDDVLVGGGGNGREESESVDGPSKGASRRKEVLALVGTDRKGRVTLAVEALWDQLDPLKDWEGVLEILLLDHSAGGESQAQNGRVNGKEDSPPEPVTVVQDSWRLEEGEETILLEVLVASVRRTKLDAVGGKKVRVYINILTVFERLLMVPLGRRGKRC